MRAPKRSARSRRRGASLLLALVLVTMGGMLCAATMMTAAARLSLSRASRAGAAATQIADAGLNVARAELASGVDAERDGLGVVHGALAGSSYSVTCRKLDAKRFVLVSTARHGEARRTIESVVELSSAGAPAFGLGLFGDHAVLLEKGVVTDAYDSAAATYEAQAVRSDAHGRFALEGSPVGSNGSVSIRGSGSWIRGDATPGPGHPISGADRVVAGSTAPRSARQALPPIDASEIRDARGSMLPSAVGYSSWSTSGKVSIGGQNVNVGTGGVLTIPAGTYFVVGLHVDFGGVVRFAGPVRLFVAHTLAAERGSLVNVSGVPAQLQIYALGDDERNPADRIRVSAKSGLAAAIYAPKVGITVTEKGSVLGALVGRTVLLQEGGAYHFDRALGRLPGRAAGRIAHPISRRRIANPEAP